MGSLTLVRGKRISRKMAEENRRQTAKELPGSTSTSTWYKPPEAEAGEHYYKEIAKQNPRNSKARRAILDRCTTPSGAVSLAALYGFSCPDRQGNLEYTYIENLNMPPTYEEPSWATRPEQEYERPSYPGVAPIRAKTEPADR